MTKLSGLRDPEIICTHGGSADTCLPTHGSVENLWLISQLWYTIIFCEALKVFHGQVILTLQLKDSFNMDFYAQYLNCQIQDIHTEIEFYLPLSLNYVHATIQREDTLRLPTYYIWCIVSVTRIGQTDRKTLWIKESWVWTTKPDWQCVSHTGDCLHLHVSQKRRR